ncbi:MAG TPA: PolC-type DNA polymerase III [Bacillota bacterium]|nr:PolC-type DNA polymerase III [Bacillota bacterium]
MKETAEVQNSGKSLIFSDFITRSGVSETIKEIMLAGKVEKVEISSATLSWKVYYQLPQTVSKVLLEQLATEICSYIEGLQSLTLVPRYQVTEDPVEDAVERYWPEIMHTIRKQSPMAAKWLENAPRTWKGNSLRLTLPSSLGESYLLKRGWLQELSEIVDTELGLTIVPTIEVNNDETTQLATLEQQQEEQVKTLLETRVQAGGQGQTPGESGSGKQVPSGSQVRGSKGQAAAPIPGVIKGKPIKGQPRLVSEVVEEDKNVIVQGTVIGLEHREMKTGRKMVDFVLSDFTDSLKIKFFEDNKSSVIESGSLKSGMWVKVKGTVQFDVYDRELAMMAYDINVAEHNPRIDNASEKRVELHAHTKMSSMDSVCSPGDLVKKAAKWGHPAIAITDHGVVQGLPDAYLAGKSLGIKVIMGCEGYLVDDGNSIITRPVDEDLANLEYVVFDLETTGLSPASNEIIEIGGVKVKDGTVIDRFSTFVKPKGQIPPEIVRLTSITQQMVEDAPPIEEALVDFLEFAGECVLVAHNASFDVGFITAKMNKHLKRKLTNSTLDTLGMARGLLPDLKNHKLNTLSQHFNIKLENHHRAVDDAQATTEIFLHLMELARQQGITKLAEVNILVKNINLASLRPYHIIILVKNYTGLRNLYQLISKSHLEYYHRTPRIPLSQLVMHREGLLLGSACEAGQLIRAILEGASEEKLEKIAGFYDYLEIQPLDNNNFMIKKGQAGNREDLKNINRKVVELGEKLNLPVVATGDVHFLEPEDEIYRRVLLAGKGFEDADQENPLYFRTTEEMLEEFSYLGAEKARQVVIDNPRLIADLTEEVKPIPDEFYPPVIDGAAQQIEEMTYETAHSIYGNPLPEQVTKRLEKELNSIINNNFSVLYLIAHKLVKKSNGDGYLVGSRGSVGSSLVATMTGITEVNSLPPHYVCPNCKYSEFHEDGKYGSGADMPDKDCPQCQTRLKKDGHDIPFEVFLGFEGDKVPDIDLNFSGEYQPVAHKYTEELFGEGHVFRAGTTGTLAEKTAFGFVKKFFEERKQVKRNAEMKRLVAGCTGVKRTTGQHPGGVMVVPRDCDVHQFTPIQHPADDKKSSIITTHFDYHSISERLVKLDILGHDDPTAIKMLEDLTGVNAKTIPLDEPKVLQLYCDTSSLGVTPEQIRSNTGTYGIPEFGTKFVRQMLEDTRPKTFSECVRISGFSHGTDVWLNNAQDLIRAGTCQLGEAISARDDIMIYLIQKGLKPKQSFKIMEGVRKGKGVKPEDEEEMRRNNVPEWYIESCKKIKYMFPKAHAVAYVMMAFRIAYFKVYYPEAFYATYFTVRGDDFDADLIVQGREVLLEKIEEIEAKGNGAQTKEKNLLTIMEVALEMACRGIDMLRVNLEKSDATRFIITEEGLLPPFAALQGVGKTAASNIVQARAEAPFASIEDLRVRAKISKSVIEILENHGCLDGLDSTAQLELFNL